MKPARWLQWVAILVAVIGSAWKTNAAIGDLRERMARLEGLFEGFTKHKAWR